MIHRILALALGLTLCALPLGAAASDPADEDRFAHGWRHYEAGEFALALAPWRAAARAGDPRAQLNLGMLYDLGQGVAPDPERAARLYARAARQGLDAAQANLGALHAAGRGVPADPAAAARWYRAAAEQGQAFAQYQLGMLYARGLGVPADSARARAWLAAAAARGEPAAIAALAGPEPPAPARRAPWDGASVGSGWPVSAGLVVTNQHVVEGSRDIVLIDTRGREIAAEVVLSNPSDDLALLRVADPGALPPVLPLAAADALPGRDVFALGYPRIDVLGHSTKHSAGSVSGTPGGDPRAYRLDLHIEPGYSGGPLLNARGEVVGTVSGLLAVVDAETGATRALPNASVAVRVSAIRETLAMLPGARALGARAGSGEGRADVERIGRSVLVVVAR